MKVIAAEIFEEDGKVVMQKFCAEHGSFRDIVFGDVDLYLKKEVDLWRQPGAAPCRRRQAVS